MSKLDWHGPLSDDETLMLSTLSNRSSCLFNFSILLAIIKLKNIFIMLSQSFNFFDFPVIHYYSWYSCGTYFSYLLSSVLYFTVFYFIIYLDHTLIYIFSLFYSYFISISIYYLYYYTYFISFYFLIFFY